MGSFVVFSVDVGRLAHFYEAVLEASPLPESSDDIRLVTDHEEVLVHSVPKGVARQVKVASPPTPRDSSPIKPVFDVASLGTALEAVIRSGGVVTSRTFAIDGLTRHDVLDPDGNIIQLRSRDP